MWMRRRKGDRLLFWRRSRTPAMPQRGFQSQRGRSHRLPVRRSEGLLAVYTGAQSSDFMINERLINPLEPLGRCLDGSGIAQMRESQARPGPVHRVLDQPRADRIAEHVAEDDEQMRVLLNLNIPRSLLRGSPLLPRSLRN